LETTAFDGSSKILSTNRAAPTFMLLKQKVLVAKSFMEGVFQIFEILSQIKDKDLRWGYNEFHLATVFRKISYNKEVFKHKHCLLSYKYFVL